MKNTRRILLLVLGIVGLVAGGRQLMSGIRSLTAGPKPQEVGERVTVQSHGCTLKVPRGWTQKDAGNGGVMFLAPSGSGYNANLLVLSEPFGGTLREYADANIAALKNTVPQVAFTGDASQKTESGAPIIKSSFNNKVKDLELAQAMYFFDGPVGKKIIITSTAAIKQGPALVPLLDSCMQTVALAAQ